MLRVWGISGEEVAAIALEDFRNVRSLKKHLKTLRGSTIPAAADAGRTCPARR